MTVKKNPEEARSGQKLRRDRYLLPGLITAAVLALVIILLLIR